MANRKEQEKGRITRIKIICITVLAIICAVSLLFADSIEKLFKIGKYTQSNAANFTVVDACGCKIHYIDVGQGDCTLIELPDGTNMVIDAGTDDKKLLNGMISYIKNINNISVIDYLVLTHSDDDHSGGMKRVFEEFEIKNVFRPFQLACKKAKDGAGNTIAGEPIDAEDLGNYYDPALSDSDSPIKRTYTYAYCDFIESAYSEQWTDGAGNKVDATITVSYQGLNIGSTITGIDFSIEFLYPTTTAELTLNGAVKTNGRPVKKYDENNNASPVILFEYKDNSFLWTGDAEKKVEDDFLTECDADPILKNKVTNVEVYKAGHHGSSTSSTANFLSLINPAYTICSCGENNKFKHPSQAFLERWETQMQAQGASRKLNEPLRTDKNKTIIFGVTNNGELVYCSGVDSTPFVVYWWYFAVGIFVAGTIIIMSIRIYKNNAVKTAKSAKKSAKTAQKALKYFK